jgi:uncharacterized protein (DUF779 family)
MDDLRPVGTKSISSAHEPNATNVYISNAQRRKWDDTQTIITQEVVQ